MIRIVLLGRPLERTGSQVQSPVETPHEVKTRPPLVQAWLATGEFRAKFLRLDFSQIIGLSRVIWPLTAFSTRIPLSGLRHCF